MASYQPLQSSFAYGEISPRLIGRSNTDRYRSSLRTCENCLTYSHGAAVKRGGSEFIVKSEADTNVRLFPLQINNVTAFVIEMGHREATGGYVRVLNQDGYISTGSQFVDNPTFADELDGWTDTSDAQASVEWNAPGVVRFIPASQGGGRTAGLQQAVTVTTPAAVHRLETETFSNAPSDAFVVNIGTTAGASDIASFVLSNDGLSSNTFTPGVATFFVTFEVAWPGATYDHFLDYCYIRDDAVTIYEEPTPYSPTEIEALNWVIASANNIVVYFVVESQIPHLLLYTLATEQFSFFPVPFTTAPPEFGAGNYPRTVAAHQQRVWFAGTPNQPDTIWASQTLDFNNFDLGTGQPTESIKFELAGEGSIVWMTGARDLLVGLDRGEYILLSDGVAIAPGDIQARQQSAYGGALHTPPRAYNGVLYLGSDRRRVRFQNYQFLEDGWVSLDITWPSEHITAPRVQEIHFLYAPDPIVWMIMRDGSLVTAIYEREQDNLVGWHRQRFADADILSGCVTKLGAEVQLWMTVRRTVADSEVIYIERVTTLDSQYVRELDNQFEASANIADYVVPHMDAASIHQVEYDAVEDEYFIANLDYLEGLEVQILIEGAVHQPRTVELGRVTLQPGFESSEGALSVVGVGYIGLMRLLPLEGGNQGGTSQHLPARRNRIFMRLLASTLPEVNDIVTGARFPVTLMDTPEPLFTGDLQVANLGWDRVAEVTIEMPLPRPYTVLSIFGDAEVNRL